MNIQSCVCVTPWVWRGFYWIQGTLYEIADQTYCQDTVLELCWQHWKWEITQISIWEEDNQQCNISVKLYLHCGRRVLHCGRRRSIEIGMLVHKDLHCWSVLRIFTNQGKVSSNIFVNIKIFLRNLRKYLIIYPLDKNPWFGPLCIGECFALN